MKKLLIAGMTFAGAMGLFAQGALEFTDANVKSGNQNAADSIWHVWSPDLVNPTSEYQGNTSVLYNSTTQLGDYPVGTQVYTGTMIGGYTTGGTSSSSWANGANYSAALYAAPGTLANNPTSTALNGGLVLVAGSLTPFSTAGNAYNAGLIAGAPISLLIPNTSFNGDTGPNGPLGANDPTSATCQMAAWYNNGGTITTLAEAIAANVPSGYGNAFTVNGLGGGSVTPPNSLGGRGFSLTTAVPEPSTIALGVMGACAFLARRRKQ
jgi:hypothetical protein